MKFYSLFALGISAGSLITIQSVLNSVLGKKTGTLGSVFILTIISILAVLILIMLFPSTANLKSLPGLSEWYLYIGGLLGVAIVATPIFLIPRVGATSTLTALVIGQLLLALIVDHFGLFNVPQIEVNLTRLLGICALVFGVFLIKQ